MKNKTKQINYMIPTLQEFEEVPKHQIPPLRDYDALIRACNNAMLEKLHENNHKSDFDDVNIAYAISRIHQELGELEEAKADQNIQEIRREAADVANFAAMIILRCDGYLYKPNLSRKGE